MIEIKTLVSSLHLLHIKKCFISAVWIVGNFSQLFVLRPLMNNLIHTFVDCYHFVAMTYKPLGIIYLFWLDKYDF